MTELTVRIVRKASKESAAGKAKAGRKPAAVEVEGQYHGKYYFPATCWFCYALNELDSYDIPYFTCWNCGEVVALL
jgi:hypothetical protein